jgi:AraC-like DNA-binding protein
MGSTILASIGRPLWRYLEANRLDADALFRRCGLDPALINEPRSRYPYETLCAAWVEAAAITRNENLGFENGRHYTPLDLNALGVTFLSSATLADALQRLVRYESAVNSELRLAVIESGDLVELENEFPDLPPNALRLMEDCRTSLLVDLCRQGLDMNLDPVAMAFTYPEPDAIGEHFAVFRCPIKFSQPVSKISFSAADVQRPFTAINRELAISSDRILEEVIRELKESGIITRIKKAIIQDLPSGTPSEEDIARSVFLSGRTLQRRLAEEHTSFRKLVLEVRRELARKYLEDKQMPLAEISHMLGFSDTSSFSRAFKQWIGEPPATFRSRLAA